MAIVLERHLSLELRDTVEGKIAAVQMSLKFDDDTGRVTVNANGSGPRGPFAVEGIWKVDAANKSVQLISPTATTTLSPVAACIIACLGGTVGKALLECLLESTNLADIVNCLRGKTVGSLLDAAMCIAHCLGIT